VQPHLLVHQIQDVQSIVVHQRSLLINIVVTVEFFMKNQRENGCVVLDVRSDELECSGMIGKLRAKQDKFLCLDCA
jgi:hypothetical protein